MLEWFYKYETVYAERIYEALGKRELGDMTPESLQLPEEKIQRYREKALLYREGRSLCALLEIVNKDLKLLPVLREYEGFLEAKLVGRGSQPRRDQLFEDAVADLSDMIADPMKWAHRWLAEFREDPNDETAVALFADHWLRQYKALKDTLAKILLK